MAHQEVIPKTQDAHKAIKLYKNCTITPLSLLLHYDVKQVTPSLPSLSTDVVISEPNVHRKQQYPQISGLNSEVLTSRSKNVVFILKLISM